MTSWFPDGKVAEQGNYHNGTYALINSFQPDGTVMVKNGEGYHKTFYDNGVVATECKFLNGKPHGMMISRDENNVMISEVNYKEGKYDGDAKFYMEGVIHSQGSFVNNLQEGVWTWYHVTGGKEAEVAFLHGEKEGEETFWSESGEIVKREFYEKGKLVRTE
jgi:antitoxin component YwqK of YwqJK toxin-antitoxin module